VGLIYTVVPIVPELALGAILFFEVNQVRSHNEQVLSLALCSRSAVDCQGVLVLGFMDKAEDLRRLAKGQS
jgi:hypothetical protein